MQNNNIAIVFLNFQLLHGGSRDISESEVFQKAVQMVRLVNDRYIITVQIFELISLSFAATSLVPAQLMTTHDYINLSLAMYVHSKWWG